MRAIVGCEAGNCFNYGSKCWKDFTRALNRSTETSFSTATERTLRERAVKVVTKHRSDSNWRRRQSGNAEERDEKLQLMEEAASIYVNRQLQSDSKSRKEGLDRAKGAACRELAMSVLSEKRSISDLSTDDHKELDPDMKKPKPSPVQPKKSPKETSTTALLSYFREKDEADRQGKTVALELEKDKVTLEREKWETEKQREEQ
eukprot:scpid85948/ scgid15471/ 